MDLADLVPMFRSIHLVDLAEYCSCLIWSLGISPSFA